MMRVYQIASRRLQKVAVHGLVALAFTCFCWLATTSAAPLKYENVILVQGGGTDAENGAALRAAISKANSRASETKPWLVKLEPGVYESISTDLPVITTNVGIQGSGEQATKILIDFRLGVGVGAKSMVADLTLDGTALGGGFVIVASEQSRLEVLNSTLITNGVVVFATNSNSESYIVGSTLTNGGISATGRFRAVSAGGSVEIFHSRIVNNYIPAPTLEILKTTGAGAIFISQSFMDQESNSVTSGVECRAIATPNTFLGSGCPGQNQ